MEHEREAIRLHEETAQWLDEMASELERDDDAMDRFELALRQGPPGARVDAVAVDHTFPMSEHAKGFHIR